MTEKACPVCGHKIKQYRNPFVIVACTNDACYFRCNGDDYDRLSAAMEYTKCVAEQHNVYIDDEHAKWIWEEGKKAWARVKEVFA